MNDVAVVTPMSDEDVEDRVWAARLHGASVRSICKTFALTPTQVHAICLQRSPEIDHQRRRRELSLELDRLDQLQRTFFSRAVAGDIPSALLCLRISERRGAYLN